MLIIKLNNKKNVVSAMHSRTCKKVLSRRTFQLCLPLTLAMIKKKKKSREMISQRSKKKGRKKIRRKIRSITKQKEKCMC